MKMSLIVLCLILTSRKTFKRKPEQFQNKTLQFLINVSNKISQQLATKQSVLLST